MVTFWERAAHVNRVFTLLCPFVALVVSHFGVKGRTLVLFASVPGHCLPCTFSLIIMFKQHANCMI